MWYAWLKFVVSVAGWGDMIRDLFESATANGQELMTTPQQNRQPGREADQSGQCGSHQLSIQLVPNMLGVLN